MCVCVCQSACVLQGLFHRSGLSSEQAARGTRAYRILTIPSEPVDIFIVRVLVHFITQLVSIIQSQKGIVLYQGMTQ